MAQILLISDPTSIDAHAGGTRFIYVRFDSTAEVYDFARQVDLVKPFKTWSTIRDGLRIDSASATCTIRGFKIDVYGRDDNPTEGGLGDDERAALQGVADGRES